MTSSLDARLAALEEVAAWARVTLVHYGYLSDPQDPMHQLACAIARLDSAASPQ